MQHCCKYTINYFFGVNFEGMKIQDKAKLLSMHDVRKTEIREKVLNVFLNQGYALTSQDIEMELEDEIDRITLYRTLIKFVEHGILHRIENANTTHYALCDDCDVQHHNDNHLHFQCTSCNTIECFHQKKKLNIQLPPNYQLSHLNILIKGTCAKCG